VDDSTAAPNWGGFFVQDKGGWRRLEIMAEAGGIRLGAGGASMITAETNQ
jgi:hypothetical protein